MNERCIKWIPVDGLAVGYNINKLTNTENACILVLKEINIKNLKEIDKYIRITFDGSMLAYRFTDESFRFATMPSRESPWTFYIVENSEYIQLIMQQAYKDDVISSMKHFLFSTLDVVIDIIATAEPRVEFMEENLHV